MAVVLILLVVGTLVFHFIAPSFGWTFTDLASNWSQIDDTINITFWVTGIVFVAVNLFMAYAVIKYRARKGNKATYDPENKKLETWLTVLTSVFHSLRRDGVRDLAELAGWAAIAPRGLAAPWAPRNA